MDLKKVETQIPFLDFTKDPKDLEEGSDGWKHLCSKVGEACEGYGCFQVAYNEVPKQLSEEMFMVLKDLFDLPLETKVKNCSSKPHFGYLGKSDMAPLFESLGIEDAPKLDEACAFTDLMWPDGNPFFCMSRKMLELQLIILKMVLESFGLEKYYESSVESSQTVFRVMKYEAPHSTPSPSPSPDNDDYAVVGLVPHTDKGILTVLCQDEVQGLEVLIPEGPWVRVEPLPGTFIVFVGEAFKAWSNGRLHAAKHRVIMTGDKERYSYALFVTPKEEAMVEVPQELVDQDHPLRFRPFNFMDFLHYLHSDYSIENALEVYAGV